MDNKEHSCRFPSPGTYPLPFCKVYNPTTGVFEIVPAADPPQGEVFFIECPLAPNMPSPAIYPMEGFQNVAPNMPSPTIYPMEGFQNVPLQCYQDYGIPPMDQKAFVTAPGSNFEVVPQQFIEQQSQQFQAPGKLQQRSLSFETFQVVEIIPTHGSGSQTSDEKLNVLSSGSNYLGAEKERADNSHSSSPESLGTECSSDKTTEENEDGTSPGSDSSNSKADENKNDTASGSGSSDKTIEENEDGTSPGSDSSNAKSDGNKETPSGSSTPDDASKFSLASASTPSATSNSSSQPVPSESDKTQDNSDDLCKEDGPMGRHSREIITTRLGGLLQNRASGTMPWVTRIYIEGRRATFYFDTLEESNCAADNLSFGNFMKKCHASYAITLEMSSYRRQIFFLDRAILDRFFAYTEEITITGTLGVENLEHLMPSLKVSIYNVHLWQADRVGRLGSLTHAVFPRQLEHLYFDTRGTDNKSLVDNVSRLYMDTYNMDRGRKPFLKSLTLVTLEFCTEDCLYAQLRRLCEMLREDVPSSAAVITLIYGDNEIFLYLNGLGFKHSHYGFIEDFDGQMIRIKYWKKSYGTKVIALGFRERNVLPMMKEETDVV